MAFTPAGGWARGDESYKDTLGLFVVWQDQMRAAAPHADTFVSTVEAAAR